MCIVNSTFLVCVHYNNSNINCYVDKFLKSIDVPVENLILVDTSKDFLALGARVHQEDVNLFFEFSGYQYGLLKVHEKCLELGLYSGNIQVIFINDTIFTSHVTKLFESVCLKSLRQPSVIKSVTGLTLQKWHGIIIPTCCFVINTDCKTLSKTKIIPGIFFENGKVIRPKSDIENLYVADKQLFNRAVRNWLYPKSFFSGWYKACPWNPISNDEYRRKYLAIYFEHSMVKELVKSGYVVKTLNNHPTIMLLSFIDRLNNNIIKLRFRIFSYLKYIWNSYV